MKVLLSGGGTGGHVYPAIAIANKIKEENPDCEILFVGTEKGIESEIVPKYGRSEEHTSDSSHEIPSRMPSSA